MKLIYFCLLFCLYALNSFALEYSCIDKKYKRLSKMTLENELIKYQDEKGKSLDYKVIEDNDSFLMAVSEGKKDIDPILNYIFVKKDNELIYNSILRVIKSGYQQIYSEEIILKCIGKID